jgi:dTMP kinase
MAARGKLVCLIGIDGSGKTTQARLLQKQISASGLTAEYIWSRWEPALLGVATRMVRIRTSGGSSHIVGSRKRRLLSNRLVRSCWIAVSLAEYALQVHRRVTKALGAADVVVCDRYLPDYVVDQIINTGDPGWTIRRVFRSPLARAFPPPDAVVFVDVPSAVAMARKDDGVPLDVLEEKSQAYGVVSEALGAATVSADARESVVAQRIWDALKSLQGDWTAGNAHGTHRRGWPGS